MSNFQEKGYVTLEWPLSGRDSGSGLDLEILTLTLQEIWCTSLSDKYRNARRNMDSQEVVMKRRKLMYHTHSLQQPN